MGDLSAMRADLSTVTDNRHTAVDTQPHSKSGLPMTTEMQEVDEYGTKQQLSMAESMLQQSQLLDPKAGNSVVTYLNQSLRNDVTAQIEGVINTSMRERSR